jgi:Kef-type K+ transport system membrane component KefB
MGGASSFYAMLAIAGFLVAVWCAGKISKIVGISSMVFEVAVGLVLGPEVLKLIPLELSECYYRKTYSCSDRSELVKIAHDGWKYCDLDAYLKANKYTPNAKWDTGFWGAMNAVQLKTEGDGKMTYCLNPSISVAGCTVRRLDELLEDEPEVVETSPIPARRLADNQKGKVEYNTYTECLQKGCDLNMAIKCATTPDIFTLVGHTGVAMMIFESGLHFDFEQAKKVGHWACAVAVLGTFLPLITGVALAKAFGFAIYPDGLSAGTALAPTSIGIALKLLHEAKALQTFFGQAVMTAAFVDDVLSLILFSVLFSLAGEITFIKFLPLILGCVFMAVAIVAAVTVWPAFIKWFFSIIPEYKPGAKVTTHDEVMWILMLTTLCGYAQITHLCGTHLWGCFIAGMSFATQHHAHHVWVKQVKRITCWFLRIFFACTLAWSIPVKELFSIKAFWQGTLMGLGPCVATKVLCGPFMGPARWVIGWAMVGRAEFAYFIAIMAKSLNMIEDKLFAVLIWALLYATILAPLVFRFVLKKYMERIRKEDKMDANAEVEPEPVANNTSGHLPDFEQEEEDEARKALGDIVKNLSEKEKMVAEKEKHLASLDAQVNEKEKVLANLDMQIQTKNLDPGCGA